MDEKIRIVVDAMGGDNAPEAPVHGAVDALAENNKIEITLVGRAEEVQAELAKYSYDESRVQEEPRKRIKSAGRVENRSARFMIRRNGEQDGWTCKGFPLGWCHCRQSV